MSTYTVANMSGSVGKTTTVVTAAVQLAATGLKVRVIDLDPQANASTWLGYPNIAGQTIADVLRLESTINDISLPARVLQDFTDDGEPDYTDDSGNSVVIDNLTIVPAARSTLDKLMVELPAVTGGVLRLRDALEAATPVDVTLIDSPGSNSALVTAALIAASVDEENPSGSWGLITCTKPAGKESEGIQALLKELAIIKRTFRIDVPLLAIVPCAVPATGAVYAEQMEYLQEGFGDRVTPAVRRSSIVDEAYTNYTPVPLYGYRAKDISNDYAVVIDHMKRLGMFRPAAINA
jgi:cellulose biosynthesis protein BcsQ